MSLNDDLSRLFKTMAALMEIKGESVFKAIAFTKVSRLLGEMTADIRECVEQGTLCDLEGVGAASQAIIEEYVRTGRSTAFDELSTSVPPGLIPMLDIPGLGPKTISLLWKERGVTNLEELVKAIDAGKLAGLKGIGEKKIQSIKEGIAMRAQAAQRMGLPDADAIARQLVERLRQLKPVKRAEIAGSLRRRRETIGDVDLVCAVKEMSAGNEVSAAFVKFPEVQKVLGQGQSKSSVLTVGGLQVDLRIVPAENFGAALLYFTGSKEHNVNIRGLAQDQGLTLNEWGLYDIKIFEKAAKKTAEAPQCDAVASKTEADIYKKLGLEYVEPELREDRGEVAAAREKKLPKLIELSDIRGDLHNHTIASDGAATIEQMAEAAIALGYEYLAITDHSKSQVIANGLTAERLLKHVAEIHKVGERLGKKIKLLAGCEVDILVDGRMDYDDVILKELDIVIGSPHVSLQQDTKKATDRILRAIENRYVNVIGHPTGRLINRRAGLPLDFGPIIKAAAQTGTALEINASYPRFDLNEIHARAAIDAGVTLSIDTDAHSPEELQLMTFGIGVARRAWVRPDNILNTFPFDKLQSFLKRKR